MAKQEIGHKKRKLREDEFELELVLAEGVVGRLIDQGGPWDFVSPVINNVNYPVGRAGTFIVRYRRVPGVKLYNKKRYVIKRPRTATWFDKHGLRFPDVFEVLLVAAKNHRIGREEPRLTAFVAGGNDMFCVSSSHKSRGGRRLTCLENGVGYYPSDDFLAVVDVFPK